MCNDGQGFFCFRTVKRFPKEVRTKQSAQVRGLSQVLELSNKEASSWIKWPFERTQRNLDTYPVEYGCSRSIFNKGWRRKGKDREWQDDLLLPLDSVISDSRVYVGQNIKKMSSTLVVLVLYNPNTGSNSNTGSLNLLSIKPHAASCCDGFACQRCILWLTGTSVMQASKFL